MALCAAHWEPETRREAGLVCETISLSHRLPCINLWRTRLALPLLWNNLLCAVGLSATGAILDVLPPPVYRRPRPDSNRCAPSPRAGGPARHQAVRERGDAAEDLGGQGHWPPRVARLRRAQLGRVLLQRERLYAGPQAD